MGWALPTVLTGDPGRELFAVASRTMLLTGQTLYNAPKNDDYLPWPEGIKESKKEEVKTWVFIVTEKYTSILIEKYTTTI